MNLALCRVDEEGKDLICDYVRLAMPYMNTDGNVDTDYFDDENMLDVSVAMIGCLDCINKWETFKIYTM